MQNTEIFLNIMDIINDSFIVISKDKNLERSTKLNLEDNVSKLKGLMSLIRATSPSWEVNIPKHVTGVLKPSPLFNNNNNTVEHDDDRR